MADEEVHNAMRNAVQGVMHEQGPGTRIIGYRCSGCDRRLDLGEEAQTR